MNQTEILILFIGLIVGFTALELLFNAQKLSFKPEDNDNIPKGWDSITNAEQTTETPFPFKFESLDEKTFLIVDRFWGKMIHFLANNLTPIHHYIRSARKTCDLLTANAYNRFSDEDYSDILKAANALAKADRKMNKVFRRWSKDMHAAYDDKGYDRMIAEKVRKDNVPDSMPISKAILDDNDGKGIYHGIAHPKDDNWRNISDDDIPSPNTNDLPVEDDDDYEW